MRVKHKDADKSIIDPYVPLERWQADYLPNDKYLNYDFYDVDEIVDMFTIDKLTCELIFFKSEFKEYAKLLTDNKPRKYICKPVAKDRLNEYLMPRNKTVYEHYNLKWSIIHKSIDSTKKYSKYVSLFFIKIKVIIRCNIGEIIKGLIITICGGIALVYIIQWLK